MLYYDSTLLLNTGERPRYPDIPGAKEFAVTRYGCNVFLLGYFLIITILLDIFARHVHGKTSKSSSC